ncbi:hypothetical protein [uncultured Tateyamaria sp.]|uniref:hypothetical protein n=1 Tax=uncultured Tateyamaria sp. TaxID=455651 RepID=UPI00260523E9|nr:hypothetical protein [uncultured Tateyamaria sp.]
MARDQHIIRPGRPIRAPKDDLSRDARIRLLVDDALREVTRRLQDRRLPKPDRKL